MKKRSSFQTVLREPLSGAKRQRFFGEGRFGAGYFKEGVQLCIVKKGGTAEALPFVPYVFVSGEGLFIFAGKI